MQEEQTIKPRGRPQPLIARPGNSWSDARVAAALSMRQLSALSGVPRGTISLIERGRYIPTAEESGRLLRAIEGAAA